MHKNEIQDLYFTILEIITEAGYCPYDNLCPYIRENEPDNCIECISEHILHSGKIKKEILDVILGE